MGLNLPTEPFEDKASSASESTHGVKPLALGIVPYLNVHPLIRPLRANPAVELFAQPPSQLAAELRAGFYDAAIVPVFEYLSQPSRYTLVPGVSIASYGPVRSVVLFASGPVDQLSRIHLDPASLTSVNLLKVLLAERGLSVEFATGNWNPGETLARGEGALLIGDAALAEHGRHSHSFDLAESWRELTGLPFVFAAWVVGPGAAGKAMNDLLLAAKEDGLSHLREIAEESAKQYNLPAGDVYAYFAHAISYELGDSELEGLTTFGQLCRKHGLLAEVFPLRFHER